MHISSHSVNITKDQMKKYVSSIGVHPVGTRDTFQLIPGATWVNQFKYVKSKNYFQTNLRSN
jgi:hypothetical protein